MTISDKSFEDRLQIDVLLVFHPAIEYKDISLERIEGKSVGLYYDGILIREWFWGENELHCYFEELELRALNKWEVETLTNPSNAIGPVRYTGNNPLDAGYFYAPFVPMMVSSITHTNNLSLLSLATRYGVVKPNK